MLIIEHRLEDVLWRSVDRIVLVNEGRILADLHPDELLSGSLLAENGIREPLYVTAMRYAGIAVTPDKHPAHLTALCWMQPTPKAARVVQAAPLPGQAGPGNASGGQGSGLRLHKGAEHPL